MLRLDNSSTMRHGLILFLLVCGLLGTAGCSRSDDSLTGFPVVSNFNHDWEFFRFDTAGQHRIDSVAPSAWEKISLPHTARIEPKIANDQWQGEAYYRKSFELPAAWAGRKVYLRFEGAMNKAEVWLNNAHVLTHQGGYLPFIVDLSAARFGQRNAIVVQIDNRDNPVTGPKPLKSLDFNMYGGIYRDVSLIAKHPLHITDAIQANRVAGGGIFISYPDVSAERAQVRIKTHIKNDAPETLRFSVQQTLFFGDSEIATGSSELIELESGGDIENIQTLGIVNPALWSPQQPNLHRLETTIIRNGKTVDREETRIGIRRIDISKDGFSINGKKLFLRGVNRHQEYPYVGYALSNNANYRDAVKIKSAGFDYVRLSHYPHAPAFMDAADELGIVLLDAIPGWQYFNPEPAFQQQVLQTCRDMIRRDRNHPSVIAWECSLNETKMPPDFVERLHAIVHAEYPGDQAYSAGWLEHGYDIYLQARQHRLDDYKAPGKPYIVSEYGDWEYYALNAGLVQDGWGDLLPAERSSRQLLSDGEARLLQQASNIQEAHNDNFNTAAFADGYWAMFDYSRGYADDLEASGTMSIDRLPKYSYYFFQSQRDPEEVSDLYASGPMVYIANQWSPGSATDVRVFSNCAEIELFLNDASQGRQRPDAGPATQNLAHPPFTFRLEKFTPGKLEAMCLSDNKALTHHVVFTRGKPERIDLAVDISNKPPQAGVNDLLFVYARIVDKNGTVVPVTGEEIAFEVTGDALIVNPGKIVTEAGIATALLKIGNSPGTLTLLVRHHSAGSQRLQFKVDP
jgi:beta-galactosidase